MQIIRFFITKGKRSTNGEKRRPLTRALLAPSQQDDKSGLL